MVPLLFLILSFFCPSGLRWFFFLCSGRLGLSFCGLVFILTCSILDGFPSLIGADFLCSHLQEFEPPPPTLFRSLRDAALLGICFLRWVFLDLITFLLHFFFCLQNLVAEYTLSTPLDCFLSGLRRFSFVLRLLLIDFTSGATRFLLVRVLFSGRLSHMRGMSDCLL